MEGEAGVLQQRVQVLPVHRRNGQPQEGVRGEQQEGQKGHPDHPLHGQHTGAQGRRQVASEPGHAGPIQRQDQHPEQKRAFVVPPDAGNLVDQRLERVRVLHHQPQRKVRGHKGIGQRGKGKADQQQLRRGSRFCDRHPAAPATMRPDQRHN